MRASRILAFGGRYEREENSLFLPNELGYELLENVAQFSHHPHLHVFLILHGMLGDYLPGRDIKVFQRPDDEIQISLLLCGVLAGHIFLQHPPGSLKRAGHERFELVLFQILPRLGILGMDKDG